LSPAEREEIMVGLRTDQSLRSIARALKRNPSVIAREIQSNRTEDGRYQAYWAEQRSQRRRRDSRKRPRISDPQIREYLRAKLQLGWSPEQIAGRIARELPEKTLSHETIYLYIFKQEPSLTQYLSCGRKQRRKRAKKHSKRVLIAQRRGIEERSEAANQRTACGHWEADTAVSRQSPASLLVLQERKLGLTLLEKLPRCAPRELSAAITDRLSRMPASLRQSVTFDNGQENRRHFELHTTLGLQTFFCNPYSSWEKGSVENAIGLTRRVWPKKSDYALLSVEEVAMLEYRLNTRPRKRLGYRTPLEYAQSVALSP
jgi:IS30 family transposase|tara:strand:- start:10 stop:957 length:948 start_codon:yes stop_codon:yes gene_type:complete